jgi:hypothetical protein
MNITKKTQAAHWASKDLNVINSYWTSPPATKRSLWFVDQLRQYEFESIFEVGYFSGRNIKYLHDVFDSVYISGLEINKKAVRFARQKLPDLELLSMNLHDMNSIDKKYDVVFSSGVLIHVPPEDLKGAVEKMIGISNKYVMHIESIGNNEVTAGPKHLNPTYKISGQTQWAPDLLAIYKDLGYNNIRVVDLPEDCRTNGASELIIVEVK